MSGNPGRSVVAVHQYAGLSLSYFTCAFGPQRWRRVVVAIHAISRRFGRSEWCAILVQDRYQRTFVFDVMFRVRRRVVLTLDDLACIFSTTPAGYECRSFYSICTLLRRPAKGVPRIFSLHTARQLLTCERNTYFFVKETGYLNSETCRHRYTICWFRVYSYQSEAKSCALLGDFSV